MSVVFVHEQTIALLSGGIQLNSYQVALRDVQVAIDVSYPGVFYGIPKGLSMSSATLGWKNFIPEKEIQP